MSAVETAYLLLVIAAACVFVGTLAYGSWHAGHQ